MAPNKEQLDREEHLLRAFRKLTVAEQETVITDLEVMAFIKAPAR